MMHRSLPSLLACLALSPPLLSEAQEWARFRGQAGTGIGKITSLPNQFTKADYDWAIKLKGKGHSSPVLWGDRLFITLVSENGKDRVLECIDSKKGARLWKWSTDITEHNLHNHNNFASSTPVASTSGVFVTWGSGEKTEALGFDHDGNLLWKREWDDFSSDHGFGSSPIISDGVLILHTDSVKKKKSYVMGLDPASGETLWELERITENPDEKHLTAYNTPVSITVDGVEMVVVLQTNDGWRGLASKTGEMLWHYPSDYALRNVGSIATGDGMVFATFGSGGAGKAATALIPNSNKEPTVLYHLGLTDGLSYVPTPLLYENRLYLLGDQGGILTCRKADDGKLIYRERIGGNFFSSPVIADGKIWCGSRDGELVAIKTGDQFEVLGRSRLGSGMNATPAIADNRLFLRTDTHLISIKGR